MILNSYFEDLRGLARRAFGCEPRAAAFFVDYDRRDARSFRRKARQSPSGIHFDGVTAGDGDDGDVGFGFDRRARRSAARSSWVARRSSWVHCSRLCAGTYLSCRFMSLSTLCFLWLEFDLTANACCRRAVD